MNATRNRKKCWLVIAMLCISTLGFCQWVVTDFYNGVINTVSQTIQAASKIISSEEFKHVVKVYDKLKEVNHGVQEFRRIQEVATSIQTSAQYYTLALNVVAGDPHFSPDEIASFYATLEQLVKQDARLLGDLQQGIQANILEMTDAERMDFIMKIHTDAAASAARLKGFVGGLESLSMQRARTNADRLATLQRYAQSRNQKQAVAGSAVNFGTYHQAEIDFAALDEQGMSAAQAAQQKQSDWMNDPANPQARESSMRNLLNDPMPQKPDKPRDFSSQEKWDRYYQLRATYPDRLENWQAGHSNDLRILGKDISAFVMNKPSELSEQEWMEVLMNKLRKGQI